MTPPTDAKRPPLPLLRVPESLPFGVLVRGLDGELLWANTAFTDIVGVPPELGSPGDRAAELYGIVHRDGRSYDAPELPSHRVVATAEAVVDDDMVLRRPDGTQIPMRVFATPLRDDGGALVGAVVAFLDVSREETLLADVRTASAQLQASLVEADRVRALGLLAASVAHEINNPLSYMTTSLVGVSEELARLRLLLDRVAAGDASQVDRARAQAQRLERLLRPVREGIERVSHVTRDLEILSRQKLVTRGPVDASGAMRTAIDLAYKEIMSRARVRLDLGDTAFVDASEPRLVQVFLNLLMHAAHAIPENANLAEVRARVVHDGDAVLVEVSDTGPSASAKDRALLFEPFLATNPTGQGTGLGLFVCRTIVERLGGSIEATEREGGGTLMRLRLPRSKAESSSAPPSPPRRGPARHGRILLVDDDVRVARTLADALESHQHRVVVAFSGSEALAHIDEDASFDLVLCDLMMPPPSGIEVYQSIAERAPHLEERFFFMTGGAFTERALSFLQESGLPFIEKPFDVVAEVAQRLR